MKARKIELLPNSEVMVYYADNTTEIKTARGLEMKPWGRDATVKKIKTHTRRIKQHYGEPGDLYYLKTKRYMPRKEATVWILIEYSQREYVQDITEEDAKKEGVENWKVPEKLAWNYIPDHDTLVKKFSLCWDEINSNRKDKQGNILPYTWNDNPRVWVIVYSLFFQGRGCV